MPELDYLDHGRVILPTNADPAIVQVEGYERLYLGLDLGRRDPTALVLSRDRQLPEWSTCPFYLLHRPSQRRLGFPERTSN